jgi:transcription elongation GreA/GreB family factor
MDLKQNTHSQYIQLISDRIQNYRNMIADLSEDAQNDAKGSAGDKHETALAMMHIEQEKLNMKLKEVLEQKSVLESIDVSKVNRVVALGSLVETDSLLFFISTALSKITVENKEIIALSPNSPLGKEMLGKAAKEVFSFNGIHYQIISVQ